jgi:hypothetical protein
MGAVFVWLKSSTILKQKQFCLLYTASGAISHGSPSSHSYCPHLCEPVRFSFWISRCGLFCVFKLFCSHFLWIISDNCDSHRSIKVGQEIWSWEFWSKKERKISDSEMEFLVSFITLQSEMLMLLTIKRNIKNALPSKFGKLNKISTGNQSDLNKVS